MGQQEFPTINEVEPSWADLAINIPLYSGPTVQTKDIAAIKYNDKVDVGVKRGTNGGRKTGRTTGQLDNDASITFYLNGWKILRTALASKDKRISLVGFDIMVQFTPPGSPDIISHKIVGCRVVGRTFDLAEGPDPQKIEIPLNIMNIEEEDGITLL